MKSALRIRVIVCGIFALCLGGYVVIGWHQWYITVPTALLAAAGYGYVIWLRKKRALTTCGLSSSVADRDQHDAE